VVDAAKAFAKEPPREPLDNLMAIKRDFKWRYVKRKKTDQVIKYCKHAPNLSIAIDRAVRARDEHGKHHNHQSKVDLNARLALGNQMWKRRKEWLRWIKIAKDNPSDDWMGLGPFDALHDWIIQNKPFGIGPVTAYDVAVRVGAFLKISPSTVYMHAGVRQGMLAFETALERTGGPDDLDGAHKLKRVPMYLFPEPFKSMKADDVEDILCTYRGVFETW
jgi:hypothetical protein